MKAKRKNIFKSLLALTLALIMVLGVAPLSELAGVDWASLFAPKAEAAGKTYQVGDIVEFGSYPQSKVTDSSLVSALNSVSKNWVSYGYYSGDGSYGSMKPGDWMKYADFAYNGTKYRAVIFSQYRPYSTCGVSSFDNSSQDDNGYIPNNIYYFKYEPLKWRVLDPSTGLVLCESIIDSQAYSNTIYIYGTDPYHSSWNAYWNDAEYTHYANDYATSSIRAWLNNDFYNTAFSSSQRASILTSELDNRAYSTSFSKFDSETTYDKVFLLSWSEMQNTAYGFPAHTDSSSARRAKGTDYAKCQGFVVFTNGCSEQYLRPAGYYTHATCGVSSAGDLNDDHYYGWFDSTAYSGVRPALKISNLASGIFESDSVLSLNRSEMTVSNNVCPYLYASIRNNSGYEKSDLVWTSSNPNVAVVDRTSGVVNPVCVGDTVITVSTSDKKYSASCKLTVQSAFCMTSPDSSVTSMKSGDTSKFIIYLYDCNGDQLPIGSSTCKISGTAAYDVVSRKNNEKSIELEIKAKSSGQIDISLSSEDPDTYNEFRINVYPESVDYLADSVPVSNKKMGTNFNRSDLTVENFRYVYDESIDKYKVTMNIYNSSGTAAALVAHKANGDIYDSQIITKHTNFPTDWGSFFGILGKGFCQGMTGDLYTYRSSLNSTLTEASIEVPADGYITISNDIYSCKMTMAYNIVGICTDAVLGYLKSTNAIGDVSNKDSDKIAKNITQAILKSIPDKDKFLNSIMEKLGTGITKKLAPQIIYNNAEFAHEMLKRMCDEAGEDFADLFIDAVWSVLKSNVKDAIKNIVIAKIIETGIKESTLSSSLKVADVFFKLGSGCDLCNQIVYSTVLNPLSGVTTIQFKRDGKDGFVAKDKLKVVSDVIDEDTVLSHYVICDMQRKQLIKGELEKEFQISPDNIFEIHEIALMKNGKKIGTEMQATVEIEIPAGMLPSSVRIFRRESNGKYTDMKAYPVGNGKMMFVTTHFSEYVIVGESNVATGITLAAPTSPIPVGGSYQLVAAAQPDGASLPDLVWASSDPSVASVDENGLVKALSVGTATISVTDTASNLSAEVEIDTVQVIDFGDGGTTIKVGEKLIYTPVIQEDYVDYHYRWSSSDPSVVTVEPNEGELTGIKEGTATITMTLVDDDGNIIASSDFTVTVEKKDGFFKILFRIITAPFRAIISLFKKLFGK